MPVSVKVELPEDAGNEYQDTSCTLYFKVEAIQGNAATEDVPTDILAIYSAQDLKNFAKQINEGSLSKTYTEIKLMNDIDLADEAFTAIGVEGHVFDGVFNGNDHTISNLTIAGQKYSNVGAGLFNMTSNNGAGTAPLVKNITFDHVTVNAYESFHVGVVRGECYGDLILENVHVTNSSVTGQCNVGGLVGRNGERNNKITFKDCSVENTQVTSVGGGDPAGASAFLGMALKIGADRNIDLVFYGTNVATGNTLVSAEGHTGGGIYVIAEVVGQNRGSATAVDKFDNYNSQS